MIKFTFIFIILYWIFFKPNGEKSVNRYVTLCSILFIAMIGLRNEAIFGDTYNYVSDYKTLGSFSLSGILTRWGKDPAFWFVSFLINKISNGNYTVWFLMIAVSYMLPLTKMIRRYSVGPMYSWILFIFLGFMFFAMAGLRQTVAMSLTLTGFLVLLDKTRKRKKRLIWFACCVIAASLFHTTSLICMVGLLFENRSFSGITILFYTITLALGMVMGSGILHEFTSIVGQYDNRFLEYGEEMVGANFTYLIQQILIVLPSLYFVRGRFHEPFVAMLCHFSIIGLLFVSLSPFIAEMFRLSYYFSWANIILFPIAINAMRREISIAPTAFLLFFVFYLILINGSAWTEHYFWFENTDYVIRQMYYNGGV